MCGGPYRKPLIFPTQCASNPSLPVIPSQQYSYRCSTNPGSQHEGSMEPQQKFWGPRHPANIGKSLRLSACRESDIVEAHTSSWKIQGLADSSGTFLLFLLPALLPAATRRWYLSLIKSNVLSLTIVSGSLVTLQDKTPSFTPPDCIVMPIFGCKSKSFNNQRLLE